MTEVVLVLVCCCFLLALAMKKSVERVDDNHKHKSLEIYVVVYVSIESITTKTQHNMYYYFRRERLVRINWPIWATIKNKKKRKKEKLFNFHLAIIMIFTQCDLWSFGTLAMNARNVNSLEHEFHFILTSSVQKEILTETKTRKHMSNQKWSVAPLTEIFERERKPTEKPSNSVRLFRCKM